MSRDNDAEQKAACDAQWRAFCDFAKNPMRHCDDPRERWDVVLVARPKPKPKQTRKRKLTLARAMRQADKAGIRVASAMLTPEGVKLELGQHQNGQTNPWDDVQ